MRTVVRTGHIKNSFPRNNFRYAACRLDQLHGCNSRVVRFACFRTLRGDRGRCDRGGGSESKTFDAKGTSLARARQAARSSRCPLRVAQVRRRTGVQASPGRDPDHRKPKTHVGTSSPRHDPGWRAGARPDRGVHSALDRIAVLISGPPRTLELGSSTSAGLVPGSRADQGSQQKTQGPRPVGRTGRGRAFGAAPTGRRGRSQAQG